MLLNFILNFHVYTYINKRYVDQTYFGTSASHTITGCEVIQTLFAILKGGGATQATQLPVSVEIMLCVKQICTIQSTPVSFVYCLS